MTTAPEHPFAFLSEEYLIRSCAADMIGRWRISDVLVRMQELAGDQCMKLGCARDQLLPARGIVWVLTRTELRISRMPRLHETVTVTTWAAPPRRMFWPRYFTVTDAAGRTVIESATQWVLCDIRDRKMVSAPEVAGMIPTPDREPPFTRFTPIPAVEGETVSWAARPRYSDMDMNGHVNNTRYADWLCDALGEEVMNRKRFSRITVDYRREILPGDRLEMTLRRDGKSFWLSGARDGMPTFDIGGLFADGDGE